MYISNRKLLLFVSTRFNQLPGLPDHFFHLPISLLLRGNFCNFIGAFFGFILLYQLQKFLIDHNIPTVMGIHIKYNFS